ncbi:DEGP2 [Symbiodinium natans]|uniref:DEGP2 protein n=1 Tax=Symbiodinium natans TaxID=878477 RepID=A0A812LUF1_9DINO|nr:DEGP2 [Symbiodinium natans]
MIMLNLSHAHSELDNLQTAREVQSGEIKGLSQANNKLAADVREAGATLGEVAANLAKQKVMIEQQEQRIATVSEQQRKSRSELQQARNGLDELWRKVHLNYCLREICLCQLDFTVADTFADIFNRIRLLNKVCESMFHWCHACQGFCIDASRRQVLTNAHVVSHAVVVRVRRYGDAVSYPASVLCSSPQCDLAVLEVKDSGFWEGLGAIELSEEIPPLDADILTVGYPMGGENICVTRGVVSRIDLMDYTFSPIGGERQLVIQVDAAINPGNSGGPVLDTHGRAVGVAFAGLRASANIGYVIPGTVVHFFLRSLRGTPVGLAKGLCALGVRLQHTKSPALRRLHGLEASEGDGVLVTDVAPLSPAADGGIVAGDVLLAVDDVPVAEDGTVPFRDMERIGFEFLVTRKVVGETIRVQLRRAGDSDQDSHRRAVPAELKLQADYVEKLVPRRDGGDAQPSYLILGGLVFVRLTLPWMLSRFREVRKAPPELQAKLWEHKTSPDQEVVVLAKVLAAEVNYGYEDFQCLELLSFGSSSEPSQTATNLKQLYDFTRLALGAVEAERPAFLRFEFNSAEVVLDVAQCGRSGADILRQHGIARECSEDLLDDRRSRL